MHPKVPARKSSGGKLPRKVTPGLHSDGSVAENVLKRSAEPSSPPRSSEDAAVRGASGSRGWTGRGLGGPSAEEVGGGAKHMASKKVGTDELFKAEVRKLKKQRVKEAKADEMEVDGKDDQQRKQRRALRRAVGDLTKGLEGMSVDG